MYECYSLRRFLRLLLLDAIIFGLCFIFVFIGKSIVTAAESRENGNKDIFLPAIMYHSIHEGEPDEYIVTPLQLERDLQWLSKNGYTSVTAQQLVDYTAGNGELPEKPVLITFDDGYYNNLVYLVPLLEKYDMHAIISVVGSYAEKKTADASDLKYSYLSWDDLAVIENSERIEIGNHTYSMHSADTGRMGCSITVGETAEEYSEILTEDISLLQAALHDKTGTIPFVFSYPYGFICSESVPVLKNCGFLITLTSEEKPNYVTRDPECLYGIGRYNRSGIYTTEDFMSMLLREK